MTSEDFNSLTQGAADRLAESLRRPWKYSEFEMELKTAINQQDIVLCRELLKKKGQWLTSFKGYELTELMDAAIRADAAADELVGLLLQSGVPAHCVYDYIGPSYQHTPLFTAARIGRLDLVQKLAMAGADVFWTSPSGANALSEILPSKAGQAPTADTPALAAVREWLTQLGLRIDPLCADSRRKLRWATAQPTSWPDIPALLALGIPLEETGWTPFMLDLALGIADAPAAANLAADEIHHTDAWKRTPFLLAVAAGDLEMAQALLGAGSDLHTIGHCEASSLHLAAEYDHCHLLEWLLANGLPLEVRNEFGNSALHAAVGGNCVNAAALLIEKGADIRERDRNGYALIHQVSLTDDLAMLRLLLKAGAEVNDISGGGCWPLHDACQAGNTAAVSFLLKVGANPNLTSTGETALFSAVASDSLECVRLLLAAGADVNATDCDGWTSLFHLQSEQVARYLLEHGADPGIADQPKKENEIRA
jgi:ankyrin repeat protein